MKKTVLAGFAAALLCTGFSIGQAHATVIDGTWSGSASGAGVSGTGAPDPLSFSATFSFDDSSAVTAVPITDFTTNFGATSADFTYSVGTLFLTFDAPPDSLSVLFSSPSTDPTLSDIQWVYLTGGSSGDPIRVEFDTISGSFTPASMPPATVPEPASLAIFASGLIGLGFLRRKRA